VTLRLMRHVVVLDLEAGEIRAEPGGLVAGIDPEAVAGGFARLGPSLRCPIRLGGRCLKLDEPLIRLPPLQGSVRSRWVSWVVRLGEMQLAVEAALGNPVARDLAELIVGSARLWALVKRRANMATRFARDPTAGVFHRAEGVEALLLGRAPASEARRFVWGGSMSVERLAVAARYGYYTPMLTRFVVDPGKAWMLVLAIYSAFDVLAEPGGVVVNGDAVEAIPYAVLRVLGRWIGVARVVGGCAVIGQVNAFTQCPRIIVDRGAWVGWDWLGLGSAGLNACPESPRIVARTPDTELVGDSASVCEELSRMLEAGSWYVAWSAT